MWVARNRWPPIGIKLLIYQISNVKLFNSQWQQLKQFSEPNAQSPKRICQINQINCLFFAKHIFTAMHSVAKWQTRLAKVEQNYNTVVIVYTQLKSVTSLFLMTWSDLLSTIYASLECTLVAFNVDTNTGWKQSERQRRERMWGRGWGSTRPRPVL